VLLKFESCSFVCPCVCVCASAHAFCIYKKGREGYTHPSAHILLLFLLPPLPTRTHTGTETKGLQIYYQQAASKNEFILCFPTATLLAIKPVCVSPVPVCIWHKFLAPPSIPPPPPLFHVCMCECVPVLVASTCTCVYNASHLLHLFCHLIFAALLHTHRHKGGSFVSGNAF
jgi:hypothetical protein